MESGLSLEDIAFCMAANLENVQTISLGIQVIWDTEVFSLLCGHTPWSGSPFEGSLRPDFTGEHAV